LKTDDTKKTITVLKEQLFIFEGYIIDASFFVIFIISY